jgi:PAS domain S-box-containing protein
MQGKPIRKAEEHVYTNALRKATESYEELVQELSILRLLNDSFQADLGFNEICNTIVQFITDAADVENASVMVMDQTKQELRLLAARNLYEDQGVVFDYDDCPERVFKLGEGIAGQAAQERRSILINDTRDDERFITTDERRIEVRSILSLPLIHGDKLHGVLNLSNSSPNAFDSRKEHVLNLIASTAAVALSRALIVEELQHSNEKLATQNRELTALVGLSESLHSNLDIDAVLSQSLSNLFAGFDCETYAFFFKNTETGAFELRSFETRSAAPEIRPLLQSLNRHFDEKMTGVTKQVSHFVLHGKHDAGGSRLSDTKPSVAVPLYSGDDYFGVLVAVRASDRCFGDSEIKFLISFCDQISMAIQNSVLVTRLKRNERHYRLLADNVRDVIWTLDMETLRFTYVSPSVTAQLGYSVAEAMAESPDTILAPTSLETLRNSVGDQSVLEHVAREGRGWSRTMELEQIRKDGSTIWTEVTVTVLHDASGRPIEFLGVSRDITDRKRLEGQLLQAQKMESIGTLAGGIAHDFNNLLGGILGFASLTKSKIPIEHQIYEYVDTIEKSATRAAKLTSQLLAFARGGKYEPRPINLNSIINETLEIIGRTFDKSIEIETSFCDAIPTVEADAGQMQQVIMNLCVNAHDAMETGGKLILRTDVETVTHTYFKANMTVQPGAYVTMTVSDTGIGIEKDEVQRIFEPFYTTKKPGKGTGLGLSMVYGAVKNHGGFVNVYSEPAMGTTFKVYLPASDKPELHEPDESGRATGGNELILVADDEEAIRTLAKEILESHGYRVMLAEDGREAVDLFEKHHGELGLVILDMVMPRMGGRETFLKMKELNPQARALLSTGYSQDGKAEEILKSGVRGFIQKPYQVDTLLSKVRSVLDTGP